MMPMRTRYGPLDSPELIRITLASSRPVELGAAAVARARGGG
jgi:hypothetical protein